MNDRNLLVCAVLVSAVVAGCAATVPLQRTTATPLRGGSAGLVRGALVLALEDERHRIEGEEPGAIHAVLNIGRGQARVTLRYDGSGYAVQLREAHGLDLTVDPATGRETINRYYPAFLRRLERRARSQIAGLRPAPRSRAGVLAAGDGSPRVTMQALAAGLEREGFQVESAESTTIVASRDVRGGTLRVQAVAGHGTFEIIVLDAPGFQDEGGQLYLLPDASERIDDLAESVRDASRPRRAPPARVVVTTGVVGGRPAGTALMFDCESAVEAYGHSRSSRIHCSLDQTPACQQALLEMGHSPTSLMFCSDTEPNCAANHLYQGGAPTALMRCKYQ